MKIKALMTKESGNNRWVDRIPIVVESDHPRYLTGTRFDWGFVQCALDDGYIIEILPDKLNKSNCKHKLGFNYSGFIMGYRGKDYRSCICPVCHDERYILKSEEKPEQNLPANYSWENI